MIPAYAFFPWGSGHEKDSKAKEGFGTELVSVLRYKMEVT